MHDTKNTEGNLKLYGHKYQNRVTTLKKYLFISNSNKPSYEKLNSREKIKLDNVSIPCIEAAKSMGYDVYVGINRKYARELESDYEVKFYFSSTYRSLYDFKSNFMAFRNLMSLIREEKFDVIHCNTPIGGILGRLCGKIGNVPKIIYTAHGFHFYKGASLKNQLIFRNAEKMMARYTDVLITINNEDYEAAKKFKLRNKGKVYYVPGVGVDTELYHNQEVDIKQKKQSLGLNHDDIVLISMGDLIPRKNYITSIKAVAKANRPNIKYLICGKGPELANLQTLAHQLGVSEQVMFLGYRNDIKELLAISDIFLFTTYQEGLPRSMMEAMAAGLPCVASRIRGNVDLIDNGLGGYLIDPKHVTDVANAIRFLINDNEKRRAMSAINRERIENFHTEKVKDAIYKLYQMEL